MQIISALGKKRKEGETEKIEDKEDEEETEEEIEEKEAKEEKEEKVVFMLITKRARVRWMFTRRLTRKQKRM